jgi:hypothetical protein
MALSKMMEFAELNAPLSSTSENPFPPYEAAETFKVYSPPSW